ncbi:hypothetical protein GGI07_001678 [Coemansia sp. Benny D115]|nr:hypothetical protein GGI07_001678 [Coemansia sp. Benny D115]
MELRNRRLSGEGEEAASDQNVSETVDEHKIVEETTKHDISSDDEVKDEGSDMEDVGGGFLGDFEEIEEDEDVERFISQNHTPSVSTRHSPAIQERRIVGPPNEEIGSEESSDEDSFESIDKDPAVASKMEEDSPVKSAVSAGTKRKNEAGVPVVSESIVQKYRVAEERFCDRWVPKLKDGRFFDAAVYRAYSVVGIEGGDEIAKAQVQNQNQNQNQKQRLFLSELLLLLLLSLPLPLCA